MNFRNKIESNNVLFKTAFCSVISLFVMAIDAMAAPNSPYLELDVGAAINSDKQSNSEPSAPSAKSKHEIAAVTSMSLGYRLSPSVRLAWNFSYLPRWRTSVHTSEPSFYHANLSSLSTTINGYYDISSIFYEYCDGTQKKPAPNIMPYITGGVGVSRNEVGDVEEFVKGGLSSRFYGNSNFNFVWRLGAGVAYKINRRTAINLGYNFVSLGGVKTKGSSVVITDNGISDMIPGTGQLRFKTIYSQQLLIGIRVSF